MKAHKENYMKDETRLALLEQSIEHISETLIRIEKKFEKIDQRFDLTDKKFEALYQEIKESRNLSWSHFRWIIGIILVFFGSLIFALLKGHIG
jgi:uncharacterized coiled-coil protein SlyX